MNSDLISLTYFWVSLICVETTVGLLFHRYCDDYAWYEFERVEEVLARYPHENIEHFIFNLTH
jgi:hypothetical protein